MTTEQKCKRGLVQLDFGLLIAFYETPTAVPYFTLQRKYFVFTMQLMNFQFNLRDGIEGPFQLEIDYIALARIDNYEEKANDYHNPWLLTDKYSGWIVFVLFICYWVCGNGAWFCQSRSKTAWALASVSYLFVGFESGVVEINHGLNKCYMFLA